MVFSVFIMLCKHQLSVVGFENSWFIFFLFLFSSPSKRLAMHLLNTSILSYNIVFCFFLHLFFPVCFSLSNFYRSIFKFTDYYFQVDCVSSTDEPVEDILYSCYYVFSFQAYFLSLCCNYLYSLICHPFFLFKPLTY